MRSQGVKQIPGFVHVLENMEKNNDIDISGNVIQKAVTFVPGPAVHVADSAAHVETDQTLDVISCLVKKASRTASEIEGCLIADARDMLQQLFNSSAVPTILPLP